MTDRRALSRILALPLIAGALLRALGAFCLAPHVPTHGDSNTYLTFARHFLASGSVFDLATIDVRPPLYFLLVALGLVGGDPHPWVYLLQSAFDLGTCALLASLALRRFGARAATATAWVGALLPTSILYCAALVMAESVVGFCAALALVVLDRADGAPRPLRALCIGLVLAVAIQVKELGTLVAAAVLLAVLFPGKDSGDRFGVRARAAATIVVGLAIGLAPWTIATARVVGRPLPTGTYGYWALMYDNARGPVNGHLQWTLEKDRDAAIALARRTFRAALLEYPGLTARRAGVRLRVLVGPETYLPTVTCAYAFERFVPSIRSNADYYRTTWRLPESLRGRQVQLALGAWMLAFFTLTAAGTALAARTRVARVFLFMLAVAVVVVALTVSMDRYRQGFVPAALPLAGLAVARLFAPRGERWTRAAMITAIVVGASLFVTMFVLDAPAAPVG